jgi:ketosteroid isomerase-like protein
MEIIAVSKDFGYCTMEQVGSCSIKPTSQTQLLILDLQHYWGTTTDGNDFDFKFRISSNLRKRDEKWKWVHEQVSFPVNIATQIADFTCSQHATEHLKMKHEDNIKIGTEGL